MRRRLFTTAIALTLACSDSNTGPPAETGSIQLAASSSAVTLGPAGNAVVTVTLTRAGGYTGDVVLAVSGLPSGMTATVTPQSLSGVNTTANIVISGAAGTASGTYALIVTGTGAGIAQANTTFQVTVPVAASFTLGVATNSFAIATSSSGTLDIVLQRTNFTGPIELSLLNPPAGVTATITPPITTGNAAVLTLIVSPGATPGIIPLILRARAQGMTDRTVSVDLTIRTPVAGTRVQYQFCSPAATPVYFAYQDGTGAWQTATGAQQGNAFEYAFDIASGRGGVAMVFAAPGSANIVRDKLVLRRSQVGSPMQAAARRTRLNGYETVVQYGTTSELADDGIEMCAVTRPTKTVSVLIAGIPQGSYGILSYGNTTRIFNPAEATEPAVTFDDAVTGVSDFVATRTTPQNPPDRIILLRDLNVPDGGMLPAIDFNAAGTLTPATAQVTVTGSLNDPLEAFVDLVTANSYEGLWMELASSPATVRTWAGLSQQDMRSSDFHALIVFASAQNESGDFRVTQRFVDYVTNQTLAMGPLMSLPGISQLPSGTRLRFQGVLPGEYDRGLAFTVADTSGLGNSYFMTATTGYLAASGGAFQYNLAMPDLTALAGFPFASLLGAGDYDVAMDAYGFNGPGAFGPRPVRGGEFRAAVRNTSITIN